MALWAVPLSSLANYSNFWADCICLWASVTLLFVLSSLQVKLRLAKLPCSVSHKRFLGWLHKKFIHFASQVWTSHPFTYRAMLEEGIARKNALIKRAEPNEEAHFFQQSLTMRIFPNTNYY